MRQPLPIDDVLGHRTPPPDGRRLILGTSRQGREIGGYRLGDGPIRLSLIAGCHADEPVGPAMLDRLAGFLAGLPADHPLLARYTFLLVPHANPDGDAANAGWTRSVFAPEQELTGAEPELDLALYLRQAVREPPGDDVEFGFPRDDEDRDARPENRAIADFMAGGAPLALHASFHGMAFAAGPWFLLEQAWIERTSAMRRRLRARVRELGYRLHDVDRGGEKGFWRIDEGFTTRPDSRAMRRHFEERGDPRTATLFRPSSMELARSLGGDPLTLVSEMPLFLLPADHYSGDATRAQLVRPGPVRELSAMAAAGGSLDALRRRAAALGVEAMPVRDQMRLQLEYLDAGLEAVERQRAAGATA